MTERRRENASLRYTVTAWRAYEREWRRLVGRADEVHIESPRWTIVGECLGDDRASRRRWSVTPEDLTEDAWWIRAGGLILVRYRPGVLLSNASDVPYPDRPQDEGQRE